MAGVVDDEFPHELTDAPKPVVALVGLPDLHDAIKATLCPPGDAGGAGLHFIEGPVDGRFAAKKQDHDYENYSPGGILKKNWMRKHRESLPGVVLCLFDAAGGGGGEQLRDDVTAVLDQVKSNSRKFKVAIGLVMTSGDQHRAESRAEWVRKVVGAGSVVVVINIGGLNESARRVEATLVDLAVVFYKDEARRLKKQREKVSRMTQPHLNVRLCFKIAYFAEFRNDLLEAVTNYQMAYAGLGDVSKAVRRIGRLEVQVVAGYINYRLCALAIRSGRPTEAVEQFQRHVASFRDGASVGGVTGFDSSASRTASASPLAFVHHKWMRQQYAAMAGLIAEAQKANHGSGAMSRGAGDTRSSSLAGLGAVEPTMQPAYFLAIAAEHARKLRDALEALQRESGGVGGSGSPGEGGGESDSNGEEFVGQLPVGDAVDVAHKLAWREDVGAVSSGVFALLTAAYEDCGGNAGNGEGVGLVGAGPSRVATTGSSGTRQRRLQQRQGMKLAMELAREHERAGNAQAAKALTDTALLPAFRADGWATLMSSSLQLARRCAVKLEAPADFVAYSMELCSKTMSTTATAARSADSDAVSREQALAEMLLVLRNIEASTTGAVGAGNPLGPFAGLSEAQLPTTVMGDVAVARADGGGKSVTASSLSAAAEYAKEEAKVWLDLDHDDPFVACRMRFDSETVPIGSKATFHLHLKLQAPVALTFTHLFVLFSDGAFNVCVEHGGATGSNTGTATARSFVAGPGGGIPVHTGNLTLQSDEETVFSFEMAAAAPLVLDCLKACLCYYTDPSSASGLSSGSGPAPSLAMSWRGNDRTRARSWIASPSLGSVVAGDTASGGGGSGSGAVGTRGRDNALGGGMTGGSVLQPHSWTVVPSHRRERSRTSFVMPEATISVELNHAPPALANELYRVRAVVRGSLSSWRDSRVIVRSSTTSQFVFVRDGSDSNGEEAPLVQFPAVGIALPTPTSGDGSEAIVEFFLKANFIGELPLVVKVVQPPRERGGRPGSGSTSMEGDALGASTGGGAVTSDGGTGILEKNFIVLFQAPFKIAAHLAPSSVGDSGRMPDASAVTGVPLECGSPCRIRVAIESASPHPLRLLTCALSLRPGKDDSIVTEPNGDVVFDHRRGNGGSRGKCQGSTTDLSARLVGGDVQEYVFDVTPRRTFAAASIGSVEITWCRDDDDNIDNSTAVCTAEDLPAIACVAPAFTAVLRVAPNGMVGHDLPACLCVHNKAPVAISAAVKLGASNDFVLSGPKHVRIHVPPFTTHETNMVFVPVTCGLLALPTVHLVSGSTKRDMIDPRAHKVLVLPGNS